MKCKNNKHITTDVGGWSRRIVGPRPVKDIGYRIPLDPSQPKDRVNLLQKKKVHTQIYKRQKRRH